MCVFKLKHSSPEFISWLAERRALGSDIKLVQRAGYAIVRAATVEDARWLAVALALKFSDLLDQPARSAS